MHIDNASLQSFARGGSASNGKTVGVGELREALGGESRLASFSLASPFSLLTISSLHLPSLSSLGRSSMSTTNLGRSPSVSTAGTQHLAAQSLRRTTLVSATDPTPAPLAKTSSTFGSRRTLKSGEVSDVFRKLGIGKEGKLGSSSGPAGSTRKSRFAVPVLPSPSPTTPTGNVELG